MEPVAFEVADRLSGDEEGDGAPLVLLHGLTATRRNVVQGSRGLVRAGFRQVSYDARGHGRSSPASPYAYTALVEDLEAVLADRGLERAVLIGSSMGAATAMAFALAHPEHVPALVQITPAFAGQVTDESRWDRLAAALEHGGIAAFVDANDPDTLPERWRESVRTAITQRMERHEHLGALVDALREVPRSRPWEDMQQLEELAVPTLVIGSRDDADPLHPLAVAQEYVRLLPNAELAVEDEGQAPLAWQGGRLSRAILDFLGVQDAA